jgi:hypothetical protein
MRATFLRTVIVLCVGLEAVSASALTLEECQATLRAARKQVLAPGESDIHFLQRCTNEPGVNSSNGFVPPVNGSVDADVFRPARVPNTVGGVTTMPRIRE